MIYTCFLYTLNPEVNIFLGLNNKKKGSFTHKLLEFYVSVCQDQVLYNEKEMRDAECTEMR